MNFIRNLIDKHKVKKLAKEMEIQRKHDEYLATLDAKLATAKKEMLSKLCPLNGRLCEETCVHFEDGMIRREYRATECRMYSWYVIEPCNCKLWRKR